MDQNGCIEMQWPSKRIPPGGMLHPRKVVYSPETHKMLKVLMDEAKLTILMRKKLDWCLRSGGSLGDVAQNEEQRKKNANTVSVRPRTSRRRSYSVIQSSGDLERERFRPTRKAEDREIIKKRLQDIMEFGRETELVTFKKDDKKLKKNVKAKAIPSKMDILYELLSQIQDREEWLKEMESLGEGEKHREVINSQIADRIRRIENLKIDLKEGASEKDNKCKYSSRSEPSIRIEIFEDVKENSHKEIKVSDPSHNKNDDNQDIQIFARKLSKSDDKSEVKHNEEKEFSEKEFGGIFNTKKHNHTSSNSLKRAVKENMRGFSIEGSPCKLSGKSDESKPSKTLCKVSKCNKKT